jgi:ssDNA-binding Zn-finger/Zn-ribbon topoisomerase 1
MTERQTARRCPRCLSPLIIRINHETKQEHLRCAAWVSCDYAEELPQDIIMRRLGEDTAPRLEGF